MEKFDRIVLNIPHSAPLNGVFNDELGAWPYNAEFINHSLLGHCDLFTDYLFNSKKNPRIYAVIAEYSRFVVDMERLIDDPLESIGQGIIYTKYESFHRNTIDVEVHTRLMDLWQNYQMRLYAKLVECSEPLLIDCHSFSSIEAPNINICIGYNEDSSKPDDATLQHVVALFESANYNVGINQPYSNSITPLSNKKRDGSPLYKSFMIEVNKKVYMDEYTHTIKDDSMHAIKLMNVLQSMYTSLLK
jgi:N-formylglutamate amidohydrolase